MKKAAIFLVIVCVIAAIPSVSFTEDAATVRLAKTIYTLAKNDDYETKLALATVVMNRLESPWYPNTLEGVLEQKQQFPCGTRYDEESLRASHEALAGKRTLGDEIIAYQAKDATSPRQDETPDAESGNYNFYATQAK